MNKHQNLNSVDLQNAAEMLTARVKRKKENTNSELLWAKMIQVIRFGS